MEVVPTPVLGDRSLSQLPELVQRLSSGPNGRELGDHLENSGILIGRYVVSFGRISIRREDGYGVRRSWRGLRRWTRKPYETLLSQP